MGDPAKCASCGRAIPADAPGGACPVCALAQAGAPPPPSPSADEVAAKLPGYEILGVLGSGGMGVVFKARQRALDRIVALKVLPPATAATPGFAERFQREAKAMARLAHPNIVAVHEFGEAGGLFYLVLEFVDGLNVREAMAAGRIRPGEALAIVPQVCDALQYAHDRGVVHRDIKPENVLIDKDGRVKIADFGLAKLADREAGDPSLTGAGQVMGTLRYMAPEQWERPKEVDHRADIYSLGVVFYEMLTGELPMGKFEPPSSKAQIDVRVDEIVMRSIERDRERRWQHASDVKTKVGEIATRAAVPPPVPAPTDVPQADSAAPPKASWLPVVVPLLVTVFFGVVAIATTDASRAVAVLFWWLAGLTFFGALITAVVRWDRARRGVDATPQARIKAAMKAAAEALEEEEPKGKWLPPRTTALVTLAGIVAVVVLCGAFSAGPAGMTISGAAFVLGLVLWHFCDERKKAVVASEKGEREHPGPPVAIEVLSAVMIVVGLVGVGCAVFGRHEEDDEEGTHIDVGPFGIHATSKPAKPKDPPENRAPWDFEMDPAKGESPALAPSEADRQGIWSAWSKAQAFRGVEFGDLLRVMYDTDDGYLMNCLDAARRKAQGDAGALGLPLFAASTELSGFQIQRARFSGWAKRGDGTFGFISAMVQAGDGTKTLRFAMRFASPWGVHPERPVWLFAAAPVEIE